MRGIGTQGTAVSTRLRDALLPVLQAQVQAVDEQVARQQHDRQRAVAARHLPPWGPACASAALRRHADSTPYESRTAQRERAKRRKPKQNTQTNKQTAACAPAAAKQLTLGRAALQTAPLSRFAWHLASQLLEAECLGLHTAAAACSCARPLAQLQLGMEGAVQRHGQMLDAHQQQLSELGQARAPRS